MPDLTLSLRLTADGQGFVGEVRVAREELDKLTDTVTGSTAAADRQSRASQRLTAGMSMAGSAGRRLAAGMRTAGRAQREQAAAARQAATANRGLIASFRAAHPRAFTYVVGGAADPGKLLCGESCRRCGQIHLE